MLNLNKYPEFKLSREAHLFHAIRSAAQLQVAVPDDLRRKLDEALDLLFSASQETVLTDRTFYRARVHNFEQVQAFGAEAMGAPPSEKASLGRVQLAGHAVLYTATEPETAISETRPAVGSVLSIAEFSPRSGEEIFVLNLTKHSQLGVINDPDDPGELNAWMQRVTRLIKAMSFSEREFSRQAHPNDPDRYLDTIYIAQVIRAKGFDGIAYRSLLNKDGVNYAFFTPERLECKAQISIRKVTSVKIESEPDHGSGPAIAA